MLPVCCCLNIHRDVTVYHTEHPVCEISCRVSLLSHSCTDAAHSPAKVNKFPLLSEVPFQVLSILLRLFLKYLYSCRLYSGACQTLTSIHGGLLIRAV